MFSSMNKVLDGLFISDCSSAANKSLLEDNKIKHVVIVGNYLKKHFPDMINYMQICIDDFPGENIYKHFRPAIEFIDAARKKGEAVLVHCAAGVSRSGSIVIAYLMHELHQGLNECFLLLRKSRPCVYPNPGFYDQLTKFETELGLTSKEPKPSVFGFALSLTR